MATGTQYLQIANANRLAGERDGLGMVEETLYQEPKAPVKWNLRKDNSLSTVESDQLYPSEHYLTHFTPVDPTILHVSPE